MGYSKSSICRASRADSSRNSPVTIFLCKKLASIVINRYQSLSRHLVSLDRAMQMPCRCRADAVNRHNGSRGTFTAITARSFAVFSVDEHLLLNTTTDASTLSHGVSLLSLVAATSYTRTLRCRWQRRHLKYLPYCV